MSSELPGEEGWDFVREFDTPSVLYERAYDQQGGAIVGTINPDSRIAYGSVNGQYWEVPIPDTAARYAGDRGGVHAIRFRYEAGRWYIYMAMHNNTRKKPEFRRGIV